jgi:hypothetical protein
MKNRNGSYKKVLLPQSTLQEAGEFLRANLCEMKKSPLSGQDFTTLYILLYLRLRSPKNWLQRKKLSANSNHQHSLLSIIPKTLALTDWEKEKLEGLSGEDLFSDFALKGIPESVNRAMVNWYRGNWKIKRLEHIPTSRELLKLQVQNTRCITTITESEKCDQLVLSSRDPLSFVLHDLMHADQFFSQEISLKGQLGFYSLINSIYDKTETKKLLKTDALFKKEFEYVASDMNAYVIHLFKCLKSSIQRTNEHEVYFPQLLSWWNMNDEEKFSSQKLNTPDFCGRDEMVLKDFFERHQEFVS